MFAVRVIAIVSLTSGCFVLRMPPKVPKVDQPTLAPDAVIELETGRVNESRSYTEKSDVCSRGGTDCVQVRTHKNKTVAVNAAGATVDGTPISIGQVAAAASPEYVSETEQLRGLTSNCRRGRIIMMGGGVLLTAAYFLLQVGFGGEQRNTPYAVAGIGALGAGATSIVLGRFAFGGQDCGDAEELYGKWSPVYRDPNAIVVKHKSAEMLEVLVTKFNRDRAAAAARAQSTTPAESEE